MHLSRRRRAGIGGGIGLALVGTLCAACTLHGAAAAGWEHEEAAFIGWQGERVIHDGSSSRQGGGGHGGGQPWVQQLSWKPRAYLYHNFITAEEALELRKLAAPQMRRGAVVGCSGSSVEDEAHTSYGTYLQRLSHAVVERVAERVAEWVQVPPVHQEDVQVLRYGVGQKYAPHMDSLINESPRMATVLIYLAETEEGGETAFPDHSEWLSDEVQQAAGSMSSCAGSGVAVRPRLGDALLFYNLRPDGTHDPIALHTGCPVLRGHKWTATFWIHSQPFRPKLYAAPKTQPSDPGLCRDNQPNCAEWAAAGECEKNREYMTGAAGLGGGECRASCGACEVCQEGDRACWRRNREKGGWLLYDPDTVL